MSEERGWPSVLSLLGTCPLPVHTQRGLLALQGSAVFPLFTVHLLSLVKAGIVMTPCASGYSQGPLTQ